MHVMDEKPLHIIKKPCHLEVSTDHRQPAASCGKWQANKVHSDSSQHGHIMIFHAKFLGRLPFSKLVLHQHTSSLTELCQLKLCYTRLVMVYQPHA